MSCYHPNIMTYNPGTLRANKDGSINHWKFEGAGFEEVIDGEIFFRLKDGTLIRENELSNYTCDGEYQYSLMVPCQQCLGCRIDYSKHWADRIVMEQMISPPNTCFFVTLTYNDEALKDCLTGKNFIYTVDGEELTLAGATLVKRDLQLFFKRLRAYYVDHFDHDGIRYYAVGEYGSKTRRPHFHVCFFNLPILDLELYANNFRGDALYNSPTLEKLWGKGYVVIGELNWETAAYTARYCVKKFKGKQADEFYESMGDVLPEFSLSSRRPGIAGAYFDKEVETIYRHDCIQLPSTRDRDGRTTVPRYFDKLLEKYLEDHPDSDLNLAKIKADRRALSETSTYNRRILSGLFDQEYFKLKEESFRKSISMLSRKNVDKSLDL